MGPRALAGEGVVASVWCLRTPGCCSGDPVRATGKRGE
jgi:hypothetical protein